MHLRSEAGEAITTGNGEPRLADDLPQRRHLRLEAVDAGDDRLEPRRAPKRLRNLDRTGQRLASVAATRIMMTDEVRDAEGAQGFDMRFATLLRVVRIESEAESGDDAPRFSDLHTDRLAPMTMRRWRPETVSVTDCSSSSPLASV